MAHLTVPEALDALTHDEPSARRRGAEALGVLAELALIEGPERVVDALLGALGDAYADVRGAVVSALGQLAPRLVEPHPVVARLMTALDDVDPSVRVMAARALGHVGARIGDDALRRTLVEEGLVVGLDDFDGMVRREVVAALEMVALDPAAVDLRAMVIVPLSVTLAEDDDRLVRYYAARALGRLGVLFAPDNPVRYAIEATLTAATESSEGAVAKAARNALASLVAN